LCSELLLFIDDSVNHPNTATRAVVLFWFHLKSWATTSANTTAYTIPGFRDVWTIALFRAPAEGAKFQSLKALSKTEITQLPVPGI
jgi:hypothetical protein